MSENEWPDSELPESFDWSLSMKEVEKRYSPAPVKVKKEPYVRPAEADIIEPVKKDNADKFLRRLQKKWPYAYERLHELGPDMPRWIYDNLISKPI